MHIKLLKKDMKGGLKTQCMKLWMPDFTGSEYSPMAGELTANGEASGSMTASIFDPKCNYKSFQLRLCNMVVSYTDVSGFT
jgi:hypothetical protein